MRLRDNVAPEDIRGPQPGPEICYHSGCCAKLIATRRKCSAIDRAGGRACNNPKRIATRPNAAHLAYALQDAGVIGSAGATARHSQTKWAISISVLPGLF